MTRTQTINKEGILHLYPDDFEKWSDWKAVCDSLRVDYNITEVEIFYNKIITSEVVEGADDGSI